MLLTQEEVFQKYKISRTTLLKWETKGILKNVVKLPESGHRRYLISELDTLLGIQEGINVTG